MLNCRSLPYDTVECRIGAPIAPELILVRLTDLEELPVLIHPLDTKLSDENNNRPGATEVHLSRRRPVVTRCYKVALANYLSLIRISSSARDKEGAKDVFLHQPQCINTMNPSSRNHQAHVLANPACRPYE